MTQAYDERQCSLGEGPLWHPIRKELFWFDINAHKLLSKAQTWQFDEYVSAAGWVDRDHLLIASESKLFIFGLTTGKSTQTLCALEADNPVTRSNDGRADPQGGFWIGTMGKSAEQGAGAIYRWYQGELRKLYPNITISNSICFAPDGKTAYFCDSPTKKIMKADLDWDGWPIGDPQVAVDLNDSGETPDGSVVDADGNIWNAQWGSARIAAYSPTTGGEFLHEIKLPAAHTTCPAFAGTTNRLFCTSSTEGVNDFDPATAPKHGMTFESTVPACGQLEHQVITTPTAWWPPEWKFGMDGIRRYNIQVAQIPEWTTPTEVEGEDDEDRKASGTEGSRLPKTIVTENATYLIQDVFHSVIDLGGRKKHLIENSNNDNDAKHNTDILNDFFLNTMKSGDTIIFPKGTTYYFAPGIILSGKKNNELFLDKVTICVNGIIEFMSTRDAKKQWRKDDNPSKVPALFNIENITNFVFTSATPIECGDAAAVSTSSTSSQQQVLVPTPPEITGKLPYDGELKYDGNGHGGRILGGGKNWWGIINYFGKRPKLIQIINCKHMYVSNLLFKDSPYWTFDIKHCQGVEVSHCKVVNRFNNRPGHSLKNLTAFNTDGFDIGGMNRTEKGLSTSSDVYMHDLEIWCQDDCVAVKAGIRMAFERIKATGLGLAVGTVGMNTQNDIGQPPTKPYPYDPTNSDNVQRLLNEGGNPQNDNDYTYAIPGKVDNVTFYDCYMDQTMKGIYLKFRVIDDADKKLFWTKASGYDDWGPTISNITCKNIEINDPIEYGIWIGPAQQARNVEGRGLSGSGGSSLVENVDDVGADGDTSYTDNYDESDIQTFIKTLEEELVQKEGTDNTNEDWIVVGDDQSSSFDSVKEMNDIKDLIEPVITKQNIKHKLLAITTPKEILAFILENIFGIRGDPCSLLWPTSEDDKCPPAKGWYRNIKLQDIRQTNVKLNEYNYLGVIVGSPDFPMKVVTFDNVNVTNEDNGLNSNQAIYVTEVGGIDNGLFIDSKPVPEGFESQALPSPPPPAASTKRQGGNANRSAKKQKTTN